MNSKQRVLRTLQHTRADRVPLDGWFTQSSWEAVREYYHECDDEKVLNRLGIDFRPIVMGPAPALREQTHALEFIVHGATFSCADYLAREIGDKLYEDEWGVRIQLHADGKNWGYAYHPLHDLTLDALRIPDVGAPGRFEKAEETVKRYPDACIYAGVSTCFRRGWLLTGFTKFLEAILTERRFVETLLDHLLEYHIKEATALIEVGADMIELLGDLGTEESLFLAPRTWRDLFKPRMKALIDAIKRQNPDVYVFLHTDGMVEPIIPDLMDIGVEILNPIQPECMDPARIKTLFGSRLTLHGTMSLQKTFRFGTPDDVVQEARSRIEQCGDDGGLVLSPSNVFTQDIPVENIVAFYEYVKAFKW
jgi:uroporphyrinogen decarboxylase